MAKKIESTPIDLQEKVEVTITKKGTELTTSDWEEGEVIEVHPKLAEDFIKRGFATAKKESK